MAKLNYKTNDLKLINRTNAFEVMENLRDIINPAESADIDGEILTSILFFIDEKYSSVLPAIVKKLVKDYNVNSDELLKMTNIKKNK